MRWGLALLALLVVVPGAAASSPGRVLYTLSNGAGTSLFTETLDGSDVRNLSPSVDFAGNAVWSPDGLRIAYTTNRDTDGHGASELYVVDARTGAQKRLTFDATMSSGFKNFPTWSPDGRTLAYAMGGAVWTIPADGGTPAKLAAQAIDSLSWSPDGSRLLADVPTPGPVVATIDASSGVVKQLAPGQQPVWSPSGAQIAFDDAQGHVAVMNADGTAQHEATDMSSDQPQWIDERTLIFSGNHIYTNLPETRYGYPVRTNIFSVAADGSTAPRRLTGAFDELAEYRPATQPLVSPDGTQFLWRWPGYSTTWRENVDGTCQQPVPLSQAIEGLSWQPGSAPGRVLCAELWIGPRAVPSRTAVALREQATISVPVENHGNLAAHHVVLRGEATTPATTVSGCLVDGCEIGTLAPGSTATVAFGLSSTKAQSAQVAFTVSGDEVSPAAELAVGQAYLDVLPCTRVGTLGADRLYGTHGADRICGLAGADYISAGPGDDRIDAGNGNDTVYAAAGPRHGLRARRPGHDLHPRRRPRLDRLRPELRRRGGRRPGSDHPLRTRPPSLAFAAWL